jgi:pimeloyl-ACP methyl ester carboxylesterase
MATRGTAKPVVVMIHGAFCGPWSLDGFRRQFEQAGYAVRVPALRFHDASPPPEALATTGLADFCADLEEELAALKAPPVLLGYSMGGLLAQLLAARKKVRALVLVAPSAPWGVPPSTLFEIGAAQALLLNTGFWNRILEPNRDAALATSFNLLPREARDQVFSRMVPESGRATFEILHWGMDMNRASEVDCAKVACPLLFLSGAEDRINPPGTVARAAALYKGRACHETFPGMGHWLIGEPGWEKVARRALEWLDGLEAPGTAASESPSDGAAAKRGG